MELRLVEGGTKLYVYITARELNSAGLPLSPTMVANPNIYPFMSNVLIRANTEFGYEINKKYLVQVKGITPSGALLILSSVEPTEYGYTALHDDFDDDGFDTEEDYEELDYFLRELERSYSEEELRYAVDYLTSGGASEPDVEYEDQGEPCPHCGSMECGGSSEGQMGIYFFSFTDIEHVISLSERLYALGVFGGRLYHWEGKYYYVTEKMHTSSQLVEVVAALLLEYGRPERRGLALVEEYGKSIYTEDAVKNIVDVFIKRKG